MTASQYECLLQHNRALLTESREDRTLGVTSVQQKPSPPSESPENVRAIHAESSTPPTIDPGEPSDKW